MVLFQFFYEDESKRLGLLNYIKEQFPEITSLLYIPLMIKAMKPYSI